MRLKGSAKVLEARRQRALQLLQDDISLHEVARQIGCHPSSVMRWRDRLRLLGEAGLKVGSSPGRPPRLSVQQRKRLLTDLLKGPGAFGWRTEVWTTARIAQLIKSEFDVSYHPAHVGRLMHALGWSHQKPERRALQRNEAAIADWKTRNWTRVKKTLGGWLPT
jgi:transposase